MVIVHVESGLGNQMLDYCEFLIYKHENPLCQCFVDTIIFDIEESHKVISMWNGLEIDKIFGVDVPNIKNCFTQTQWDKIISDINMSKFWENDWSYPQAYIMAFNNQGIDLISLCSGGGLVIHPTPRGIKSFIEKCKHEYKITNFFYKKLIGLKVNKKKNDEINIIEEPDIHYHIDDIRSNFLCGHSLKLLYKNSVMTKYENLIKSVFVFPELTEEKNIVLADLIKQKNSVSIHARRGDFLCYNSIYYTNGYFERATSYIKSKVSEPLFLFFCDTGSICWVKENYKMFGLNKNDNIIFVDWNTGDQSFRDMQLMSLCKHNIITNSSFGWWGSFLNSNPEKITISCDSKINTTDWF